MANLLGLDKPVVWTIETAFAHLNARGHAGTRRTAERVLHRLQLLPPELHAAQIRDQAGAVPTPSVLDWQIAHGRKQRQTVLFGQLATLPGGAPCLHANDARGARYWVPLARARGAAGSAGSGTGVKRVAAALRQLARHLGKPVVLVPHGELAQACSSITPPAAMEFALLGYAPSAESVLHESRPVVAGHHVVRRPGDELTGKSARRPVSRSAGQDADQPARRPASQSARHPPYLDQLEAESIHILREAVAEAERPVMLYSLGKDSSAMLHLARKAFYPAAPPFPLLHVDTRWKFRQMYLFRDQITAQFGLTLIRHVNPEAIARNINPFDHGAGVHTDITKTQGLKQALDAHQFDVVFGGARRDEEASRAKERIFSLRTAAHRWDPKNQRPELWNLFNTRKQPGESLRVFPLSNWTELDIWQYISRERIAVVPLYFARERPVVQRCGMLLIVDDARMPILPGEQIERRMVRMRSLGCYPLSAAVESSAANVDEIIAELRGTRFSERQGRLIDTDAPASMERKKQEGYF